MTIHVAAANEADVAANQNKPSASDLPEHKITVTAPGTNTPIDGGQTDGSEEEEGPQSFRPEKFKTDEEWRKAYDELSQRFSKEGNQREKPVENQADSDPSEFLTKYSEEFFTNKGLSDQSYDELAQRGYPRDVVDAYIEGRQAIQERAEAKLLEVVGGREAYEAASEWAAVNYTDDQLEAFNQAMNSGDDRMAHLAMRALKIDYTEATGGADLVKGSKGGDQGGDSFRSNAEVTAAMRDPRYSTDPAYRADVEARLVRSRDVLSGRRK
jgi:hypothetical protein